MQVTYHSIYARSSEEKPEQRLSPLVPQPQEWHSMKATYHPSCALLSPAVRNVQFCHLETVCYMQLPTGEGPRLHPRIRAAGPDPGARDQGLDQVGV